MSPSRRRHQTLLAVDSRTDARATEPWPVATTTRGLGGKLSPYVYEAVGPVSEEGEQGSARYPGPSASPDSSRATSSRMGQASGRLVQRRTRPSPVRPCRSGQPRGHAERATGEPRWLDRPGMRPAGGPRRASPGDRPRALRRVPVRARTTARSRDRPGSEGARPRRSRGGLRRVLLPSGRAWRSLRAPRQGAPAPPPRCPDGRGRPAPPPRRQGPARSGGRPPHGPGRQHPRSVRVRPGGEHPPVGLRRSQRTSRPPRVQGTGRRRAAA